MNIQNYGIGLFIVMCATVSAIISVPPEVKPLTLCVPHTLQTTVVDQTPLGQSLAAEQITIKSFQEPTARIRLLSQHQDLAEMLRIITLYVEAQEAWLPASFVTAWKELLQQSIDEGELTRSGYRSSDLVASINEVVVSVAQAAEAITKAVKACMSLLKQLHGYVGLSQTRAAQQMCTDYRQAMYLVPHGEEQSVQDILKELEKMVPKKSCLRKGKAPLVVGLLALVAGVGVAVACAISLLTPGSIKAEGDNNRSVISSHQHHDANVPTCGVDVAVWRGTSVGRDVRPELPRHTASPCYLPRCIAPYIGSDNKLYEQGIEPVRQLGLVTLVKKVIEQPVVIGDWFDHYFTQQRIESLEPGIISSSLKKILKRLFFNETSDELTSLLVPQCAWALRQLVATGTPSSTRQRPVATITNQPAPSTVVESRAEVRLPLLGEWKRCFKCDDKTWSDASLFLCGKGLHRALEQVGISPPEKELASQLRTVMVAQFIDAVALRTSGNDRIMAQRIIAEHLFYGLPRFRKHWQKIGN